MKVSKEAERVAKEQLQHEFGKQFSPRSIVVGSKSRSFDLVSQDGTIVAQVKSCSKKFKELTQPQLDTRFQRDYIFDSLLLSRVQADRRLFFLAADGELFGAFTSWAEGLVPEVEMRWMDTFSF